MTGRIAANSGLLEEFGEGLREEDADRCKERLRG